MGKLRLKSPKKKNSAVSGAILKAQKPGPKEKAGKKVEEVRAVVRTGFAKKGEILAVVVPAVVGKDGKNVLGERITPEEVLESRLVAGSHVRVEKGTKYIMDTNGVVTVLKDDKGTNYIEGKTYRHGRCTVKISDDEMVAFLTVTPPVGGAKQVSFDDVISLCREKGITYGIKEDVIRETVVKVVSERIAINDVVIAEGEEPVHGVDADLEFKVRLASGSSFTMLQNGKVDFKKHDSITHVAKDQLIAVVHRAKEGEKAGHSVMGDVIAARRGEDIELEVGSNVQVQDDGDTVSYISKIGGQLVMEGNRISVEPILTIQGDVGPKTGNVNFNGIVAVQGSVADGFNVLAGRDITVTGNVGCSVLQAGGNIVVQNGIIGKNRGLVYAKGDVTAKFAENSEIHAGGTIDIKRAALNCKLIAGRRILSLKEKGQIVGGELKAREGVEVKILGNESEHKMEIYVGSDFVIEMKLRAVRRKLVKYQKALKKLFLLMDKVKKAYSNMKAVPQNIRDTYNEARKRTTILKIALNNLKEKERQYLVKLSEVYDCEVIARESLYKGVHIYFGSTVYNPKNAKNKVRISYNRNTTKVNVDMLL